MNIKDFEKKGLEAFIDEVSLDKREEFNNLVDEYLRIYKRDDDIIKIMAYNEVMRR